MPRVEHQIFEFVALVHAEVVDTHTAEVHRIVLAVVEGVLNLLQFGLQIVPALEVAGQHTFRYALALRLEQHKVLFYAVEFRPQDLLLDFWRLRDHAELLVREDHRIPVVVLDLPEYLLALLRREILAARIEHAGHRIRCAERLGDLMDIGFQSRNHRFVHQSDAFFLVGSAAHDKRLAAADLVVHDTAAQQNIHPNSVLLARIEVFDAQRLAVEAGKGQVRTVVLRAHETVELAVIHVGQTLLEVGGLVAQPVRETAADLVDLDVGLLYLLPVAYLYLFPLAVDQFAGFFGDVRNRVVQGVFHQMQSGITAELSLNGILVLYLDIVLVFGRNAELVQIGNVTDLDLRFEEPRGITVVDTRRYPPLAEVEVQIFKSDGLGRSLSQRREGLPCALVIRILVEEALDAVGLLDDVARDDTFGDLVFPAVGVEVDTPFELFQHLRFARPGKFRYILDIDVRITVHAGRQCRMHIVRLFDLRRIECDGMVEDVGLVHDTVGVAFQREYLVSSRIHPYPVDILRFVQPAEPLHEVVVKTVQHYAQRGVRGQCVGLHVVEVIIGVPHLDIERHFHPLFFGQVERMEHRA